MWTHEFVTVLSGRYQAMATAHFNFKISRFRYDNEKEYISKKLKEEFKSKGIQFEYTIRCTPEQNGVVEKINRNIMETTRYLLLESGLPKIFWFEAIACTVYIINKCPTTALENSVSTEKWYGSEQNVKKIKLFGNLIYLHVPKEIRKGKFDSRSKRCLMLGYCYSNGYRLWDLEENKIEIGRDVVFDTENTAKSFLKWQDFYLENTENKEHLQEVK